MQRLAVKIPIPLVAKQVADHLMDSEGTCTCGRIMRKLDAKLVMMTAVPSKNALLAAAYCLPCSGIINRALASLKSVVYTGVQTAPVEIIK